MSPTLETGGCSDTESRGPSHLPEPPSPCMEGGNGSQSCLAVPWGLAIGEALAQARRAPLPERCQPPQPGGGAGRRGHSHLPGGRAQVPGDERTCSNGHYTPGSRLGWVPVAAGTRPGFVRMIWGSRLLPAGLSSQPGAGAPGQAHPAPLPARKQTRHRPECRDILISVLWFWGRTTPSSRYSQ